MNRNNALLCEIPLILRHLATNSDELCSVDDDTWHRLEHIITRRQDSGFPQHWIWYMIGFSIYFIIPVLWFFWYKPCHDRCGYDTNVSYNTKRFAFIFSILWRYGSCLWNKIRNRSLYTRKLNNILALFIIRKCHLNVLMRHISVTCSAVLLLFRIWIT